MALALGGCGRKEKAFSLGEGVEVAASKEASVLGEVSEKAPAGSQAERESSALLEEAIAVFASGAPSQRERERARALLAEVIRAEDNPVADFYFAECLRPEADSDPNIAVEMYERYHKAAVGKVPEAAFRVGVCLEAGQGAPRDLVQAMNWHRLAAEEGVVPAQLALAHAYHKGLGVPQSDLAAFTWLFLGGGLSDPSVLELREEIVAGLKPEQMRAAIDTASAFVNYQVVFKYE